MQPNRSEGNRRHVWCLCDGVGGRVSASQREPGREGSVGGDPPRDFLGLRLVVRACACCGHDGHVNSFSGSPPRGASATTGTHKLGAPANLWGVKEEQDACRFNDADVASRVL